MAPVEHRTPQDPPAADGYARPDWQELARRHYENFPVGSWFLPRTLRRPVRLVYAFARIADDLADEQRDAAGLAAYTRAFEDALRDPEGAPPPLAEVGRLIRDRRLDPEPFRALLAAFSRDLEIDRYEDLDDLLAYCRLSADPVGRILLQIAGKDTPENRRDSDRICSALQILNHCQDCGEDYVRRGRIYLPRVLLAAHGVREAELAAARASPPLRAAVLELAGHAAAGLVAGWPLPARVGGRFGLEIRAILAGAGLVLRRLAASGGDVLGRRPRLHRRDGIRIALAALGARRPPAALVAAAARGSPLAG